MLSITDYNLNIFECNVRIMYFIQISHISKYSFQYKTLFIFTFRLSEIYDFHSSIRIIITLLLQFNINYEHITCDDMKEISNKRGHILSHKIHVCIQMKLLRTLIQRLDLRREFFFNYKFSSINSITLRCKHFYYI